MGKVAKIVIDTNVFISAFGWDGKPEAVVQLVENGAVTNFITQEIFEELKKVVSYPKLKFSESLQVKIIEFVFAHSRFLPYPTRLPFPLSKDPDDDKFVACAISAHAEYIVSGDTHLLKLKKACHRIS